MKRSIVLIISLLFWNGLLANMMNHRIAIKPWPHFLSGQAFLTMHLPAKDSYNKCIKEGDAAYQAKNYRSAKVWYQKAAELKPDEYYPKQMLESIKAIEDDRAKEKAFKAFLGKANAAFKAAKYDTAEILYNQALLKDPESKTINQRLESIANKRKRYKELMEEAQTELGQPKPDYAKIKSALTDAQTTWPKATEPQKMLDVIARVESGKVKPQKSLEEGANFYNQGRYEQAESKFTEVIYADPGNHKAYEFRGMTRRNLGDHQAAAGDFDKAIAIKVEDHNIYHKLGWAKMAADDSTGLIAVWSQAIAMQPDDSIAYIERAKTKQYYRQDYTGAIKDLDKAVKIAPEYGEAYYLRGYMNKLTGNFKQAKVDYNMALKLGYNDKEFINRELREMETIEERKTASAKRAEDRQKMKSHKGPTKEMKILSAKANIRNSKFSFGETDKNIIARLQFGNSVEVKSQDEEWATLVYEGKERFTLVENIGTAEDFTAIEKVLANPDAAKVLNRGHYRLAVKNYIAKQPNKWQVYGQPESSRFNKAVEGRFSLPREMDIACIIETQGRGRLLVFNFGETNQADLVFSKDLPDEFHMWKVPKGSRGTRWVNAEFKKLPGKMAAKLEVYDAIYVKPVKEGTGQKGFLILYDGFEFQEFIKK